MYVSGGDDKASRHSPNLLRLDGWRKALEGALGPRDRPVCPDRFAQAASADWTEQTPPWCLGFSRREPLCGASTCSAPCHEPPYRASKPAGASIWPWCASWHHEPEASRRGDSLSIVQVRTGARGSELERDESGESFDLRRQHQERHVLYCAGCSVTQGVRNWASAPQTLLVRISSTAREHRKAGQ